LIVRWLAEKEEKEEKKKEEERHTAALLVVGYMPSWFGLQLRLPRFS